MIKFQAIDTTDNQWIGLEFQLPEGIEAPFDFPVSEGVSFRVDKIERGVIEWRFSNPHYIVVARVI